VKKLGSRLTYANVMSSLAVFLVLGGATAFAATHLGKNSVGNAQLKRNAVSTTKLRNNAVTGNKIKKGTITGSDINAGSTSFSQIVNRIRGAGTANFTAGALYPLQNGTFTQGAGYDNELIGAIDVNFPASCTQPRAATAYLQMDAVNPAVVDASEIAGIATVIDKGTGSVTRQANFAAFSSGRGMSFFAPAAATNHTLTIYLAGSSCTAGSGVTATGAGIDVIGTK
jgi:hypothetical protein